MNTNEKSRLRQCTEKIFGGLNMSWLAVILFAVGTAILTCVFLLVPVFKDTSFERMGVTVEAWILFAVLIMANCKKPLESALKVFVFFLISQPLIYLIQVPFSEKGWHLFGYYKFWFILTLCTFPMAYIGWYIRKKNWLSLLILMPILYILTSYSLSGFQDAIRRFPRMLVMAVFCLGQALLYLYAFTENIRQKLVGFAVPLIAAIILLLVRPQLDFEGTNFLPGNPALTENAVVSVENTEIAEITIENGEDSLIRVHGRKFGTTSFSVKDGEQVYRYTLEIYEDDSGYSQVRIRPE